MAINHPAMFVAGDAIGEYDVQRLIGVGFMGEVYHAVHRRTKDAVALKCLQVRHIEDPEMVTRARREAIALSEIRHTNIVYVHEAGVTDSGVVWMAMELLVGSSLRRVMKEAGRMPVPLALHYACEIADGVDAAHEYSIVHRDLKPENVFVTDKDEVRVLDLGTAKFFAHGVDTTGRAQVFGTVPYMSPEHLAGERVDARTDVYALGMLLYEMLAGEHPFKPQFESIVELGRAQMFQMPKPLCDVLERFPGYVWAIVEKAIAKDRDSRYLSMSDFANAIRSARRRYEQDVPASRESRPSFDAITRQVPSERSDYVPPRLAPTRGETPSLEHGPRVAYGVGAAVPAAGSPMGLGVPTRVMHVETERFGANGGVNGQFLPVSSTLRISNDGDHRLPGSPVSRAADSRNGVASSGNGSQQAEALGPFGTQVLAPELRAAMVARASAPSSGPTGSSLDARASQRGGEGTRPSGGPASESTGALGSPCGVEVNKGRPAQRSVVSPIHGPPAMPLQSGELPGRVPQTTARRERGVWIRSVAPFALGALGVALGLGTAGILLLRPRGVAPEPPTPDAVEVVKKEALIPNSLSEDSPAISAESPDLELPPASAVEKSAAPSRATAERKAAKAASTTPRPSVAPPSQAVVSASPKGLAGVGSLPTSATNKRGSAKLSPAAAPTSAPTKPDMSPIFE